jgi:hypothetical protein
MDMRLILTKRYILFAWVSQNSSPFAGWSQGVGPGIVSESAARNDALKIVRILDPWFKRNLSLYFRHENSRPLYLEKFVAYVLRTH